MYLHIGNGETVRVSEIVGVFDLDTASVSGVTREFLAKKQATGGIGYHNSDLPRSFLVLSGRHGKRTRVMLSRISPVGLNTRLNAPPDGAEE